MNDADTRTKYIERVKKLHFQKTGETLSDEEATDLFHKLITLVGAVYRPTYQPSEKV
jgi:hypothetical protein